MLYFEEIDTRLCFCLEKMPLSFPCAASEQSPHPTNGTPNLYHLLVIRLVTRLTWYTPVRRLLTQCNWLSIKQLIFFHSALLVYRTFKSGVPLYLAQQLRTDHPLNTRLSSQGAIRIIGHYGAIVESSFLRRAARSYNTLPVDIRSAGTVYVFKKKLKIWIKNNIPVR